MSVSYMGGTRVLVHGHQNSDLFEIIPRQTVLLCARKGSNKYKKRVLVPELWCPHVTDWMSLGITRKKKANLIQDEWNTATGNKRQEATVGQHSQVLPTDIPVDVRSKWVGEPDHTPLQVGNWSYDTGQKDKPKKVKERDQKEF